jgi:predicted transcriptional regulator
MAETFLTIQEAAQISGKSIQTIRRAIKSNKLTSKRKRTPQGFNYVISRDSVINAFKLQATLFDREKGGLDSSRKSEKGLSKEYATLEELKKLQAEIENVLSEHRKEKESFVRFMKAFQEKFMVLENQLKLIEQPKKHWFHFWK